MVSAVGVEDFVKWNPSLTYKKEDRSACVLAKGVRYCVRPGNNSDSNGTVPSTASIKSFSSTTTLSRGPVQSSDQVPSISTAHTPSPSKTGAVDSTPSPTQKDVVQGCKKWHLVGKGDGCPEIAKKYGIEVKELEKWNPAVKTDCSMLVIGFNVCVGL